MESSKRLQVVKYFFISLLLLSIPVFLAWLAFFAAAHPHFFSKGKATPSQQVTKTPVQTSSLSPIYVSKSIVPRIYEGVAPDAGGASPIQFTTLLVTIELTDNTSSSMQLIPSEFPLQGSIGRYLPIQMSIGKTGKTTLFPGVPTIFVLEYVYNGNMSFPADLYVKDSQGFTTDVKVN